MSLHLLAQYGTSINGSTAYTMPTPVTDGFLPTSTTAGFTLTREMQLLAALAGCAAITRARVESARLLRIGYPQIAPFQGAVSVSTGFPRICDYTLRPLQLSSGETLAATLRNGGSVAALALLLLGFNPEPVPQGEAFILHYSLTAAAFAATPGAWSAYLTTDTAPTIVWETTLPTGTYAIVGMDHWDATAMAARLILGGYRHRPGCSARISSTTAYNDPIFTDGRLGVYGYFTNWQMPGVEVLCSGADTAFDGWIKVIRIGGTDLLPATR